eukprot:10622318-Karenia_brevis.AAC.1
MEEQKKTAIAQHDAMVGVHNDLVAKFDRQQSLYHRLLMETSRSNPDVLSKADKHVLEELGGGRK